MVKVELSDWLYNAGIVGLYNILKISEDEEDEVEEFRNGIEFDVNSLENFGEKYFGYLIQKYEKFTSWYTIVSTRESVEKLSLEVLKNSDGGSNLNLFNKQIEYIKDKCKSNSYKSAYNLSNINVRAIIENKLSSLKKIHLKKNESIEDVWESIQLNKDIYLNILDYLEEETLKKYILGKNIMYDIIDRFLGKHSFLEQNSSNKDMYELATKDFGTTTKQYIESDCTKYKYNCIQCNRPISKLSSPHSYELTFVKKIGVDTSRKSSHFWNYTTDSYICPVCHLIYGCVPAGFTVIKGQGIFINENNTMSRLNSINDLNLSVDKSIEDLEQENYYNIINIFSNEDIKNVDKQIGNIQIVRYDRNKDITNYTFNMLSKRTLLSLMGIEKNLSKIINLRIKVTDKDYINVYKEVIQNIYNNANQFNLIHELSYLLISNKTKRSYVIYEIVLINNRFMGEGRMVNYKQIEECRELGFTLKKLYEQKKAENKIMGISHKLLNALKTKNTSRFSDTLLHSYMYIGQGIPKVFLEGLKNEEKLQTIGYAFLLGLQGENRKNKEEISNE